MKDKNLAHISIYLTANGISQVGDIVLLIALNVWILNVTHSPTSVSILWIIPALAQLLVSPWAGSITDRMDRRTVLIVSELVRSALIAGMTFTNHLSLIYGTLFVVNVVGAFFSAASAPYVTSLVPNHRRKRVNAIRGALQSGALVLGPAITGLILSLTGRIEYSIWLDAVTFFLSALSLFVLPKNKLILDAPLTRDKIVAFRVWVLDLRQALQILRKRAFFTFVLFLLTLSSVLGAATDSQEVVFAKGALHLSPSQYSFLVSVAGFGYILGAIFVGVFANRLSLKVLIGFGSLLGSSGFVIYGFSHTLLIASIGFIVLGIFTSLSSAGFSTFYQMSLPPDYMGRVANVISPLSQGINIALTVAAGLIAAAIGVRMMTIGFTVSMLLSGLVIFVTMFFNRTYLTSENTT